MQDPSKTSSTSPAWPFEALPTEILDQICSNLGKSDISCLSQTSRSAHADVRALLYAHVQLNSFESLKLLTRTLSQGIGTPKVQISTLSIMVDRGGSRAEGATQNPIPVLVSRMISMISRHSPEVEISFRFLNWLCRLESVSTSSIDVFPRVTKLEVYLGKNPAVHGSISVGPCRPGSALWSSYLGGVRYPDLKSIKIHHYWAEPPPPDANLFDQARSCRYPSRPVTSDSTRWLARRARLDPLEQTAESYRGLEKLEEIFLESPPELDSVQLMKILGNTVSKASRLQKLNLRFCSVDLQTISYLLQQEVKTLTHLTLLIGYADSEGGSQYPHYQREPPPHLCPLIRQASKNLVYLKYAAPHVCRDMFFTDGEIDALCTVGLTSNMDGWEEDRDFEARFDRPAIESLISQYRVYRSQSARERQVNEAIAQARADGGRQGDSNVKLDTELRLDREEEARNRTITDSKVPWKRSIIGWSGVCKRSGPWTELQVGASLEERGIEWTLTDRKRGVASRHSNGKPDIVIDIREELEEGFVP